MDENSVDSIVCDPPYELGFMGKKWDNTGIAYNVDVWKEALRVLKPGGFLLAFGGTRTCHRLTCAIEDAGFEIRDMIAWIYGSGFPKSLNIGKAIDKLQENEREIVGTSNNINFDNKKAGDKSFYDNAWNSSNISRKEVVITKGNSEYEGWGTALKPSLEPITVARKPLSEKTVAANVLKWGIGGINIDGCRVETSDLRGKVYNNQNTGWKCTSPPSVQKGHETGRFPANLIHDGSDEVEAGFPQTSSGKLNRANIKAENKIFSKFVGERTGEYEANSGSASRFFYCAKASKKDRDEGLNGVGKNNHPTVKPTKLMQYLVRLVTPKGGTVLDPFMGSGSTGKACKLEEFDFLGIEKEEEYYEIAKARIDAVKPDNQLSLMDDY